MDEDSHEVNGEDFDIGGGRGRQGSRMERLKKIGFVVYGDGKKRCCGIEREEKELKRGERERGENDISHCIGVFVVECESCVEFDFRCIFGLLSFESTTNLLRIRNEKIS